MVDILDEIIGIPFGIALFIWYPVSCILQILVMIIDLILYPIISLINALITVINAVIFYNYIILINLFPSGWTILIIAAIFLVFILRIYSFIKGISIFGWKIGG